MSENWIGLDIGGANIKWSVPDDKSGSVAFPLWSQQQQLPTQLQEILAAFPSHQIAVTMTGELADCFESRESGVQFIVDSVVQATPDTKLRFYQLDGQFVSAEQAKKNWRLTAAANWNAIARFSSRFLLEGFGYLLDLGSTTLDIVPIEKNCPLDHDADDFQRLRSGRLVYLGIGRTPICSLLDSVEFAGEKIPLARELFATTKDLFVYSGDISENETDLATADGRPSTRSNAIRRLARCFCLDSDAAPPLIDALVETATRKFTAIIEQAIQRVLWECPDLPYCFATCGEGAWLLYRTIKSLYTDPPEADLNGLLGKSHSQSAAAYAVATLAIEA